ncbi:MAG: hypothetical protein K6G22_14045 [Lachnospiraceae bacterium]|nr:hypothetical protein [Lachnospiraceae bacterium]
MQSLNVFEKGMGYLEAVLSYYTGGAAYLMLYVLCLCLILVYGDKREKEIFIPQGIFLICTVYNPVAPLILDRFFDVNSEYYRFFWLAPFVILIPHVFTKFILNGKKGQRIVTIVILSGVLLLSGDFIYKDGFKLAQNIYKMPDELIKVSELIHKDSDKEYTKVFLEYEYNMQMRQYDPRLLLTVDREDYLYAVANNFTQEMLEDETHPQYRIIAALIKYQDVSVPDFQAAMEATHTEYVVLDKRNLRLDYLKECGLIQTGETEDHLVYKYPLKEDTAFELVDYSVVY